MHLNENQSRAVLLIAVSICTILAFSPGLSNYLIFDDIGHILPLYSKFRDFHPLAFWEAMWSNSGPTGRPLSMATFAAQAALYPYSVVPIKVANLLLHLGNGFLVFAIARRLLIDARLHSQAKAQSIALLAAAIWLLHPLQITAVLYAVQRMTELSAFFSLLAVLYYLTVRDQVRCSLWTISATVALLTLLATISKENGVLIPIFLLVIEKTLLVRSADGGSHRLSRLTSLVAAAVVVVIIAYAAYGALRPGGWAGRGFAPVERMLTETRVLAWYLAMFFLPLIREMGLYHDGWQISTSLLSPSQTLLATLFIAGLIGSAFSLRRRFPIYSFSVLWFFAGHLLESSFYPLELVFEHRNYLPLFGMALGVAYYVERGMAKLAKSPWPFAGVGILIVGILVSLTFTKSHEWSDDPTYRLEHLLGQESSVRAKVEAAGIYGERAAGAGTGEERQRLLRLAERQYMDAFAMSENDPYPLFGYVQMLLQENRQIPEERLGAFGRSLRSGRITPSTVNGLNSLITCIGEKKCKDQDGAFQRLLEAVTTRPDATRRVDLLEIRAAYLHHVQGEVAEAISLLRKAREIAPKDKSVLRSLALYYAANGDRRSALAALDDLDKIDFLGRSQYTILQLRLAILANRIKAPQGLKATSS